MNFTFTLLTSIKISLSFTITSNYKKKCKPLTYHICKIIIKRNINKQPKKKMNEKCVNILLHYNRIGPSREFYLNKKQNKKKCMVKNLIIPSFFFGYRSTKTDNILYHHIKCIAKIYIIV